MSFNDIVTNAESAVNVKSVYGEIYEKNGTSILPAARVMGGAGGGEGEDEGHREGKGGGFGIRARPSGVYVIRDGSVRWKPALDWNRIILGGQAVAIIALLTLRSIIRVRAKEKRAATEDPRLV